MAIGIYKYIPHWKWSFNMKDKKFDCVKMKHTAAEKIYAELKNLSTEKKRSFWSDRFHKMRNYRIKTNH